MILSTQDVIEEYRIIETFGLVRGNTVRSRNIARNIIGGLRTILGGEIPEFTKIIAESREQAIDRMVEEAEKLGANAVVAIRFVTSEVDRLCSEILAYGTAVKVEKK